MTSLAVVVALVATAGSAQVLTLDEALTRAREHNPDLRVARARLEQAEQVFGKVLSNYLPRLTAGGSYTYNNIEARFPMPTGYWIRDTVVPIDQPPAGTEPPWTEENVPGLPTSHILVPSGFQDVVIQKHHQLGGQIELTQAIFAPALIPAMQAASMGVDVARLSVEQARGELLFAIAQVYFGAVTAREAWQVQERMLEAQKAHVKDAQVRYDAGTAPRLMLLRAQIDLARAEQDVIRAKGQYDGVRSTLAALLDRAPDFEVARPPAPPLPPEIVDIDRIAEARSDVEAARLMVAIAKKDRTRNTLSYLPNVGFSAHYQRSNITGFTNEKSSWALVLGVNWTLFDGGLREAERREINAKLEEANASLTAAENKVKDEVRRALIDLSNARANSVKAEKQLALAKEHEQLVQVSARAGTATAVEIADARAALLGAELAKLAETLNAELATLRLAKATGALASP